MSFCATRFRIASIVVVLGSSLILGCGDSGPPRASVRGAVTLDGAPLAQGSILFVPIEGSGGVAAGGTIADGRYELDGDAGVSLGANRVEIRAVRKSGRQVQKPFAPQGEMVEADEEAVAEEFNSASTLRADVVAGDQTLDFAVTSRPTSE